MPLVDHEDSVLIVIDAQHGFYGDRLPADESARAHQALDRMVWLAGVATRLGIPAVITEEDPKRNGPTSPAIAERLGQASALIKPTFGLTGTPEIVQAVEETGRKTAVLVGFETDVCVAQSAIGLRERGMRVVVPDDAVYSPGEMHCPRHRADDRRRRRDQSLQGPGLRMDADARPIARDPRCRRTRRRPVPPLSVL